MSYWPRIVPILAVLVLGVACFIPHGPVLLGLSVQQTSMNLALGSALASIGLTVPFVVAASMLLDIPLTLSVAPKDIVLLMLSFVVGAIGLSSGRTNMMQGAVQLVIFAAFLFLTFVP